MRIAVFGLACYLLASCTWLEAAEPADYPFVPVPFTEVKVADGFWSPRLEVNRKVTIPYALKMNDETGRLDNFRKAAGLLEGPTVGRRFNDTDVYKVIEGAAYHLAMQRDVQLEARVDAMVDVIAAAQEPDGYLFTARTTDPDHPAAGAGPQRWSRLGGSHELYNAGHLYEAAVAYFRATGKRLLLDVALKNANLLCRVFGPQGRKDAPGHQEIELGLVKLFRATGQRKYLDLSKFFLDQRGHPHDTGDYEQGTPFDIYNGREYRQDHVPIARQQEAVGHAVRASYMYAAIADVAALTGDAEYVRTIDQLWQNVVGKKLYLTGGIGADGSIEGFGADYELPNDTAYNETCAAIGNAFWNQRLFLLHGHARYLDVLERVIYNGLISGVSLSGDRFLYPNPLEVHRRRGAEGREARQAWFEVACCPGNVSRFLPSFAGYIYATRGDTLYVNLFVSSEARVRLGDRPIKVRQQSRYPWDGDICIKMERPSHDEPAVGGETLGDFSVEIRIPGWARDQPVPSDLYRYCDAPPDAPTLKINGEPVPLDLHDGFARVHRSWSDGDTVDLHLPMPIRRVVAHEAVVADRGKVALERGPLVYCAEAVDNRSLTDLVLPDDVSLHAVHQPDLLGGVTVIEGQLDNARLMAIPYYAWGNRGATDMKVWFDRKAESSADYPIRPVPFTQVQLTDQFWSPRIETNRTVTIPFACRKNEETGRINNFKIAAGLIQGKYQGQRYNDTDVYKVMEGAAYSLSQHPDPKLEQYLDELIDIIAQAQEPDGYLFTARTCNPTDPQPGIGSDRWSELAVSHELYNAGHLYEAAVAHYQATGKRTLLDVAIRSANLIDQTFGPGRRGGTPGHQEIEIGLVKLFRVTGNQNYLRLAQYFLDARGQLDGFVKQYPQGSRFAIYNDPIQIQAHRPILQQQQAVGHAVRAAYMYSGMADVAALTGSREYSEAIDGLWHDVVGSKIYLTGGIGARHSHESFGEAFELPNLTAYNETCAAIGNVFWNARLFLLHGDARYIDVLERTAYNGLISGLSLSGDRFFYPNPLCSDGRYRFNQGSTERAPWFGVACCPGNLTRFLPSFPGYVYARQGDTLFVNLFVAGRGTIEMDECPVDIQQESRYPWDGKINFVVTPETTAEFTLALRIPGWARGEALPGGLYQFIGSAEDVVTLKVNGREEAFETHDGYARLRRRWRAGDAVQLDLPMPVRKVVADDRVAADRGFVALQRGPLVYCVEWPDQPSGRVLDMMLPDNSTQFEARWRDDLLQGVVVLEGQARVVQSDGPEKDQDFTAIPYYSWANRGPGEMAVWLPRTREALARVETTLHQHD